MTIILTGDSLSIEQLVEVARNPTARVTCDPSTRDRVLRAESVIADVVQAYRQAWESGATTPPTEYGVTTGFGEFKDKPIAPDDLEQLQRNLLLSHSVGVGPTADEDDLTNYFRAEVVRAALVTRLNAFLKGHSGVRFRLAQIVEAMINTGVIPLVPLRGSVGASGDLCPLSHTFVILLGHGRFYLYGEERNVRPASELLSVLRRELPDLQPGELLPTFKEGLGLVNGANYSAAMLAIGVHDAEHLLDVADACAALAMEALAGCTRALDAKVHDARGHSGQIESARHMRELLLESRLVERAGAVQDAYSLRCAPQVHGATRDALVFVRTIAEREINAATDNPLFFPEGDAAFDLQFRQNWPAWYDGSRRGAYSAGNFHGQPLALAADFLTIAVSELANISERRIQMMLDGDHNRGLPENLTTRPGVNSGLMIAQYTAASIVSENKVLAHPASVDSIPTGANTEDHVSMSTHAARKMIDVISNTEAVLAIELMTAAQAIEWRVAMLDGVTLAHTLEDAEVQAAEFARRVDGHAQDIAKRLGRGTRDWYVRTREAAPPVLHDQPLDGHIRALRRMLTER